MASRFTSSSSTLLQSNDAYGKGTEDLLSRPRTKPLDPAEEAARMGMFGHMTRSYINFYPTRLLCKRFGVPMPEHADDTAATPLAMPMQTPAFSNGGRFQSVGYQTAEKEQGPSAELSRRHNTPKAEQIPMDETASGAVIDPDRNDVLEQEKPGQALFRAIFGSDNEDEDD